MSQSKVAAKFTKATQPNNGLTDDEFVAKTLRDRGAEGYGIFRYKTRRISDELEDGVTVPTYSLTHLEPLFDEDMAAAKALLDKQYEQRTGNRPDGVPQDAIPGLDGDDAGEGTGSVVTPDAWLDKG